MMCCALMYLNVFFYSEMSMYVDIKEKTYPTDHVCFVSNLGVQFSIPSICPFTCQNLSFKVWLLYVWLITDQQPFTVTLTPTDILD